MARIGKKFLKVLKAIDKLSKVKSSMMKQTKKYRVEKQMAIELINSALKY